MCITEFSWWHSFTEASSRWSCYITSYTIQLSGMFWHDLLNQFYLMSECRVHNSCQLEVHHFVFGLVMEPECYYHVHQNPPPTFPFLSQTNPAHIPVFLPHFLKIYFNIFLSSVPDSSKYCLSVRFYDHNFVCLPHPFCIRYISHPCHPQIFF